MGLALVALFSFTLLFSQGIEGYYQFPDVHEDQIVFCAEGDLWTVSLAGGLAQRLTTHPEEERYPSISPDGKTVLFSASYEGPTEVYTIPIEGGLTSRWTYESEGSIAEGWTSSGELFYSTWAYNKKPDSRMVRINPTTKERTFVPLDQATEGAYSNDDEHLFFVRPAYHRNVTKRYQGGTARQIWRYTEGEDEAVKLTTDHLGGSHHPMWYDGRVYFITDRDGMMNIWSMLPDGSDIKQQTEHKKFDVRYASVSNGVIVYQMAADLWKYDIASDESSKIPITLQTDLEHLRERWEENPSQYITSVNPSPEGDRVAITARGRVFVVPVESGRIISFTDKSGIRYRDASFSGDGERIVVLSDESGEFEFVEFAANGMSNTKEISSDGAVFRYAGIPSPDGKWIAYDDLESHMYVLEISSGKSTLISTNQEGIGGFSWSPDSKWLAFEQTAPNSMTQILIYNVDDKESFDLTTDRANSFNAAWSPDGKFIYFVSDRNFTTLVGSPWGTRQPEPYFDASEKIYEVALQNGTRSPFRSDDELQQEDADSEEEEGEELSVQIDIEGIKERIEEVPVSPGNYRGLEVNGKALYLISRGTGINASSSLSFIKIDNKDVELNTLIEGANSFSMSQNREKLLVNKSGSYYMVPAGNSPIGSIGDYKIDLSNWKFSINPREEWEQLFTDAWRMERDYFYDKNMHGVDWDAMHEKYFPLVARVTTRTELSDLIGRFVGELSALHTSVRGGDIRTDNKRIPVANLGAVFSRDEKAGGFRIDYIYKADPDYPDEKSPLDDPYLDVEVGDVVTAVNGREALSALSVGELLRSQTGQQVILDLKRGGDAHQIVVEPIGSSFNLRYRDWEYGNRLYVDEKGEEEIGYLHLRAMGSNDINQFYREFYPVFDRSGLIIDVRYNWGGNIDSFILEKLLRQAWMYWKGRTGEPYWNMPYSFRGHIVILVNENTYSDGEAFSDGFKRLGLGTSIGMRTWGGEIWLNSSNRLSDGGLASAPMYGVYADGEWLIEGHGFVPDVETDNLPYETFNGRDRQLDAAIEFLKKKIEEDPRPVPQPPAYPDKSFDNNR